MMRRWLIVLSIWACTPVIAENLTIDAIFGDTSLNGPSPTRVKISPDGSRVGFLRGKPDDQYQLDLWEYNVHDRTTRLLVDSKRLLPNEQLSDAEKARRERQRIAGLHGITQYDWSSDGHSLLFPLGGALYVYDLGKPGDKAVTKLDTGEGGILDPKISPKGHFVSFVRDQNLFVIALADGHETRLTQDGGGTVHNAEAEFVAQEEMEQSSGYWWADDESAIAFKRFDEAKVPVVKRFEVYPDRTEIVEQRYPAAGDPNVEVQLGLVSPRGGAPRWIDLGANPDIYLARVDWTPDSRTVTFQRETRDQKRLDLIAVDAASLGQHTLLTETSPTWIDLSYDLHFLKNRPAFVWSSEQSGHRQLALYDMTGQLIHPLTNGDWEVDDLLSVNEKAGRVYFASNKDSVIEMQVYAARLDGRDAAAPLRISSGDGVHSARFAKNGALYVDTFSNPATPPQTSIHAPDGRQLAWVQENRLDARHPYAPYLDVHVMPEFGTIAAEDGEPMYYSLYRPVGFDPAKASSKRYPVMINVYGGPTAQLVTRGWVNLFNEYMAQQGYVVFTLDNRGSAARGRTFSDAIYHRLGDVEVRDQLAGIHWLQQQPFVDAAHIGVFGWSYGGYMTVMMLAKASSQLAAGVAVAPVTDFRIYDTHYTERYLGLPKDNPDGYEQSSVFPWLNGLTSPLLLIHGMADDNVLFSNSTRLMADLQARGTSFRLMTYPGGKHGLSTPAMKRHAFHTIAGFLDEKLKVPETAAKSQDP